MQLKKLQLEKSRIRQASAMLGVATMLFGVAPVVVPNWFARCFGFEATDPATTSMMRSLGVRDIVLGMGLWSAAAHEGNFAPWLLARLLTDGGDSVAVAIAAVRGERKRRFLALGSLAIGATIGDMLLYLQAKRPNE